MKKKNPFGKITDSDNPYAIYHDPYLDIKSQHSKKSIAFFESLSKELSISLLLIDSELLQHLEKHSLFLVNQSIQL